MKKFGLSILLIIVFLIIYLLQSNFFSWFTIAGVMPNIIVMLVVFIGLFTSRTYGLTFGVLFGLLLDIFIGKKIGISAIMLGGIGLMAGFIDKRFSKDSKITIIGIIIVTTFLYEAVTYIVNSAIFLYNWEIKAFIIKILIEILYNTILTVILYPVIQKTGFRMQGLFKENKILTRYY